MLITLNFNFLSTNAASGSASLHMNGGTGYNFDFVFLLQNGTEQIIRIPGGGTVPAIYPNGTTLQLGDQLLYVLISDSNGNPMGTILSDAIGSRSSKNATLQADGSMGSGGVMVGNSGTINFWFNGFLSGQASTSYIMANKIWLNADGSTDTNPPSQFNFVLNGTTNSGNTVDNISILPGVQVLVQDGTYTITEPDIPGYRLVSITSNTMQTSVSDKSASAVTASGNYSATFTNQDIPNNALITLYGQKISNGAPLTPGLFNFTVKDENGVVVATATNTADSYVPSTNTGYGSIIFTPIEYTAADVGQHTYTVEEVGTNDSLWIYSVVQYTVWVNVSLNGNQVTATTTYPAGGIIFRNFYTATGSFIPEGTKTVANGILQTGQFTFAIENENGTVVSTGTNAADGTIMFSPINYNSTGIGQHTYTVYETSPYGVNGWITSGARFTINVDVEDDPNNPGTLIVTPTYPSPIVFQNVYLARGTLSLSAQKIINGGTMSAGQFQFAVLDEFGTTIATGSNNANGTIVFSTIRYMSGDEGVHIYTIVETTPSSGGWTTSNVSYTVPVIVTDNGNGTMTVRSFELNTSDFLFINTYNAVGDIVLNANKIIRGGTLSDGQFDFAVLDENDVTVAIGTNDAAGNIEFTPINYTLNDVGTHNYTVFETSLSGSGWTTSNVVFNVTVEVTDNGDGTITATPFYPDGGIVFVNIYESSGSIALTANKTTVNKSLTAGQFSFAVLDENDIVVATGTNDATGYILFSAIPYTVDDVGVHNYTIIETSLSENGWTVDSTRFNVTVTVTENADGTITATPDYSDEDIEFVNTYATAMDFTFKKTDSYGNSLVGVTFELYTCTEAGTAGHIHSELATNDPSCCWDVNNPLLMVTSDSNGIVMFNELATGDYMLAETQTLTGLQLPFGQWLIGVDVDAWEITITARGDDLPPAFNIEADGSYALTNYPILALPSVGSLESIWHILLGTALVIFAGFLWLESYRKKRKYFQDNL